MSSPEYLSEPLARYLDDAASGEPTPGGGSVAALTGALATTMASMVAAFTVQSKKYAEVHEETQALAKEFEESRGILAKQIQADVDAFAVVGAAYAMPKASEAEKGARRDAIQAACSQAMSPPLEVLRAVRRCAVLLPRLASIGNQNLVTDTGVAALLCQAATKAALLNVRINLAALKDEALVAATKAEVAGLVKETAGACEEAERLVDRQIGA